MKPLSYSDFCRPSSKKSSKYGNQPTEIELDGRIYRFRSKAEARYAAYLQWLKDTGNIKAWDYEFEYFGWTNQRGNKVQYCPDFRTLRDSESDWEYWEVKGYLDARSKAKLKGFSKHFPYLKLTVIDSAWFKRNTKKLKGLVPGWV